MKTLTRTMIVFLALNLITVGFTIAQTNQVSAMPAQTASTTNVPQVESAPGQTVSELDQLMRNVAISTGIRSARGGTGNTVLVIPSEEIETEELLKINEDMNIMSRILDDGLQQASIRTAGRSPYGADMYVGDLFMRRSRQTTQNMYLQGYGALFLMQVDFPLSAPPDTQEQQEEAETKEEDVDQVWANTRQQMLDPQQTNRRRRGPEREEVKYDAEKVENLKTTLIKAFKHGANIRVLKPDEALILSITGSGISDRIVSIQAISGTDQTIVVKETGGRKITKVYTGSPEDIELSSPTMLVMRARKSDIDAFAKGDLNLDTFRQRVQILSYPLLSGNVAGTTTSPVLPSRPGYGTY